MNNKPKPSDEQEKETRLIFISREDVKRGEHACYEVSSASLNDFDIKENDLVIVKLTNVIDEKRLAVWDTPGGKLLKFGYENFGEITLYTSLDKQVRYKAKKIKMLGVVVLIQRPVGEFHNFNAKEK